LASPEPASRRITALTLSRAGAAAACLCAALACKTEQKRGPAERPGESAVAATAPPPSASAPPRPRRPAEPLNVLLITIDSLRADMPWNGYDREIAPNLSKLAAESVVYTNAYSVSSYTAKSVATLLSGRYPSTLYRDGFFFTKYASSNQFIAEMLAERGIAAIGWHAHLYFGRGKGLEQGFSEWQLVPGITFNAQTDEHITSEKMTALGIELLSKPENTGKQFFAWAHYMDPHDQYHKHSESPDFGRKARDRYDSEVFYTDLWLGKLFDWTKTQSWWPRTALIISADHGEAFGENNHYKHAFEIWEVLTRVPLIVHAPGLEAQRIDQRRSHIDVPPTVLDLMGVPIPDDFPGKTLVPELYGAEPPRNREPIVLELSEDSHNPPRKGLISGDYKLIAAGRSYQLYNLKSDPGEQKDLAREEPEKLKEMRELLDKTYEKIPSVEPYGGMKLKEGGTARGPTGPAK
jgi:choline-sulfatase